MWSKNWKLNKKLQATADELEEISRLYAKSVKESLDKSKRIKELEDKIDELEEELKKCKAKRDELEKQLKECQDKNKKLEEQLKDCQNNKAAPIKKVMTSRQESKVPSTIYSVGTDSKGNVYVGTRYESWIGVVFKCLAGESKFKEVPGTKGEIWAIASDKDENIYVGTREGIEKGSVYKCLANENSFKRMEGIDKCVSSLMYNEDTATIYAKTWTGVSLDVAKNIELHQCSVGESEFKSVW